MIRVIASGLRTLRDLGHAIHQGPVGLGHALYRSQSLEDAGQSLDTQGQMRRRVLEHAPIRQQLPEQNVRFWILGRNSERAAKLGVRFIELALSHKGLGGIAQAFDRTFGYSRQFAIGEQGFRGAALRLQRLGKVAKRADQSRTQLESAPQTERRGLQPPKAHIGDAEVAVGLRVGGIKPHDFLEQRVGLGPVFGRPMPLGRVQKRPASFPDVSRRRGPAVKPRGSFGLRFFGLTTMLEFLAAAARARVVSANNSWNGSRGARFAHFFPFTRPCCRPAMMKSQKHPIVTAVAAGSGPFQLNAKHL